MSSAPLFGTPELVIPPELGPPDIVPATATEGTHTSALPLGQDTVLATEARPTGTSVISPGVNTVPVAEIRPNIETHGYETTGGSDSLTPPPDRTTVSTPAVKTCGTAVGVTQRVKLENLLQHQQAQTFRLGMKVQQD
jgi:hypothetical protein